MENLTFVQQVVALTNQFRASNGLSPLSIDLHLQAASQRHSQNMAIQDFFSHTGLDGSSPSVRAGSAGYESGYVGENIGVGYKTPEDVVNGWINSPGHRANMLNSSYNEIGIGYYFLEKDTGSVNYNSYWTQKFGKGVIEPTFDPLQYGASYTDLIQAFGLNFNALFDHYLHQGTFEKRQADKFDEFSYIASNNDLISAFGTNGNAATQHYIQYGYKEGRPIDLFQPAQYLASNGDLINAFGFNLAAASQHYIQNGYKEGRSRDKFNETLYLASNNDLISVFGYNLNAATNHYISYGWAENRSVNSFNPVNYLNKYNDLRAAFGNNLDAAERHYIEYGFNEGRTSV